MPIGLVAVLPEPISATVHTLCAELEREFGVKNSAETTPPHITFHVAQTYRQTPMKTAMDTWAQSATSCPVCTWGFGVFGGKEPILFIGVTRTQRLSALHHSIFSLAQTHAVEHGPIFEPSTWEPHITLAHDGVSAENIGPMVTYLNQHPVAWDFQLTSLSLIEAQHDKTVICHTVTFYPPKNAQPPAKNA